MTRYHRAWMRGKSRYQHDNPGREDDRSQAIIMAYLAEGMTDKKFPHTWTRRMTDAKASS